MSGIVIDVLQTVAIVLLGIWVAVLLKPIETLQCAVIKLFKMIGKP